jgi:hypothetical protein
MPQQYRVVNRDTAQALAAYWQTTHNLSTKATPGPLNTNAVPMWWTLEEMEVAGQEPHPLWHEYCDCFRAGRCSLGMTAD